MNAAEEIEFAALALQKPMHDVIGRGDSPVQQFYNGVTVFVTGGNGFLGKQLIEKLFRACNIKKMYVLLRPKKGKTIYQRLESMLKDPVFGLVREKQPHFYDRIEPVNGDVDDVRLGISAEDWTKLTNAVNIIFHVAATVRFDAPLRSATLTNVRGTREALALAKQCTGLKNFVYVSTAFCHATQERVGNEIVEQFYPCPLSPELMIQLAEAMDEAKLDNITLELVKGWPNTYTFTKALAEELVRTAGDLPLCVVRPPAVISSYYEPSPGWLDMSCMFSTSGVFIGSCLGLIHALNVDDNNKLYLHPVDIVNNAIIAAGWDATRRRVDECKVPVYNVINNENYITHGFINEVAQMDGFYKFASPKGVWYPFIFKTKNKVLYWILAVILHYIPAYIFDAVSKVIPVKPKEVPSLVKVYKKIDRLSEKHSYFVMNEWAFKDYNVKAMLSRMSEADKAIFNCDLASIDRRLLIKVWALGFRKYVTKDGLDGCEEGYRKYKILRIVHYLVMPLYLYALWSILCNIFTFVSFIFLY